jgi:hypothetical protein
MSSQITQPVSPISPAPDISDPATFETRANALLTDKLPTMVSQINTWAGQANQVGAEVSAHAATWEGALDAAYRFYPGAYAVAPNTRPDGSIIQVGDRYFNSTDNLTYTRNAAGSWVASDINTANLAATGGSALVGWSRVSLADRITTAGQMLSAQRLSVWEFAHLATTRPTPSDPNTWYWAAAINAALTYAAAHGYEEVYLPPGTYMLEATVAVPPFVGVRGAGFGTKLCPVSAGYRAITVPGGVTASTEGANAHGLIADFVLDGKGIGTDGMWLEIIAYRSFARLKIRNFTGNGLELNDSQNSDFQQLEIRGCGVNLLVSHGAGSNEFIKCQFTGAATADIKFTGRGTDPLRQFSNPTYNTFRNCIVEPLDLNKNITGVVITEGTNNAFYDCQFVNGTTSKVAISNPVVGTKFVNCMFFGLAGNVDCAMDTTGFRTILSDPYFLNLGDTEVVKARNTTLVQRPTFSSASFFIKNYTANQDSLGIDDGELLHGTTAQRPATPGVRMVNFYDTTLGKPIWWNGSAWKDATGATV